MLNMKLMMMMMMMQIAVMMQTKVMTVSGIGRGEAFLHCVLRSLLRKSSNE